MNFQEINEFRMRQGLEPLVRTATVKNRRQAQNQAARAAACRDLKAKRNKGGK